MGGFGEGRVGLLLSAGGLVPQVPVVPLSLPLGVFRFMGTLECEVRRSAGKVGDDVEVCVCPQASLAGWCALEESSSGSRDGGNWMESRDIARSPLVASGSWSSPSLEVLW